jgi:hypothetical protein
LKGAKEDVCAPIFKDYQACVKVGPFPITTWLSASQICHLIRTTFLMFGGSKKFFGSKGGVHRPPLFWEKYRFFMQFIRPLPKISPNLGYIFIHIFTPRPSYFKGLDPPLYFRLL